MKRDFIKSTKNLQKRANAKIVDMNGRYFMIGGMTVSKNTCDIYQFRITKPEQDKFQVEWRPLKFESHVFTPRNSFAACASSTHLYIWGGLQLNEKQMTQKCLSDLIQVDIQKGRMRFLPLKEKIPIHSSCLFYNKQTNSLIAYGGTNQEATLQSYLYTLNLDQTEQYKWSKKQVNNVAKQGVLWQHSCNIVESSVFNEQPGKHMIVVGGCKLPHSPYKKITQFNLETLQITGQTQLQESVVAHESIYNPNTKTLYIIGGANGGGFNSSIYTLEKQQVSKFPGHNAVGCACILTPLGLIVYGGVLMPEMLNDMIIYHE